MLLRETGFSFNGKHSRNDYGLIYAEKEGHNIIPGIERNEYQIAGISGTILLPGETRKPLVFDGTLYPAQERATQAEAQQLLRQVAAWLTAGRCPLIFDYEPGLFYMAELTDASKWSLKNWFGGELPITFTAQPFAYSVNAATATATTSTGSASLALNVSTGEPAPLVMTIKNTGAATITGAQISIGNETPIILAGMTLAAGRTLTIDMETPIGATIDSGSNAAPTNALPYASAFTPVLLPDGHTTLAVALTYGSGTKGAQITAMARGRY